MREFQLLPLPKAANLDTSGPQVLKQWKQRESQSHRFVLYFIPCNYNVGTRSQGIFHDAFHVQSVSEADFFL